MRSGLKSWRQLQNEKASTLIAEKIFSLIFLAGVLTLNYFALAEYFSPKN